MTDTDKSQTSTLFWKKGQMLIELLIAIGLLGIFLPVLLTSYVTNTEGRVVREQRTTAHNLIVESAEAMRIIRESGWDAVSTNGIYHPQNTGSNWALSTGPETIGVFTRTITIGDVHRDDNGTIVSSGGTVDPSTKVVTITIDWSQPSTQQVTTTLYLARYLDNLIFSETTQNDFDQGSFSSTVSTNTSGGEIILGGGGDGDWCSPDLTVSELDLPKSGTANAITAFEGKAYAGTGENASGVSLAGITIDQNTPPVASLAGSYDCCKTNDVFGEQNYAYVATDNNSKEIVIIDTSTSTYSESGYVNLSGNAKAQSIFVSGTTGFTTAGDTLYSLDFSSKTGNRAVLDYVDLTSGSAKEITVVGGYAYVTISGESGRELSIIDVSDPNNLNVVGWANVESNNGVSVYVNDVGTRAYLVTEANASGSEFFIIDVSDKNGQKSALASYDTSGMNPKDVVVTTGNKAIVVGVDGEEYQTIDLTNESTPTRCGGIEVDSGILAIDTVLESDGDAFSYILTRDSTAELKIIEGGPGSSVSNSGTFTSQAFESSSVSAFNYSTASFTLPTGTSGSYQIGIADPVNSDCEQATYEFLGPDGTASSYFSQEGAIHLDNDGAGYENPAKCLKYKVYLETIDTAFSPVFEDITINYSP